VSEIGKLLGKTLSKIQKSEDEIIFTTDNNEIYKMYHSQDCCETVAIDDVCGELNDLIGSPIILAEEATNLNETPDGVKPPGAYEDSYTWTFYKLSTVKGGVTIRWFGSSNGYYSESVSFERFAQ
jgi:hypothetical protein